VLVAPAVGDSGRVAEEPPHPESASAASNKKGVMRFIADLLSSYSGTARTSAHRIARCATSRQRKRMPYSDDVIHDRSLRMERANLFYRCYDFGATFFFGYLFSGSCDYP
jgi:hypothetical protein